MKIIKLQCNKIQLKGMQPTLFDREIFLFINSGSGSGIGQQLSELKGPMDFTLHVPRKYHLHIGFKKQKYHVTMHFINMRKNRDQGFLLLKNYLDQNKKCSGVVCGGDGTVTWVISELHKNQIPSTQVPFAVIPLGTGNDFSQSLGWGATTEDLISNDFRKLKKFMIKMLLSKQQSLDVWQVTATAQDYGKIEKWQNQHKNIGTTLTKPFVNYFSFGLDGKVGYSFDKHRTKSRLGNLTVYGALGFFKGITKTKSLHELLQNFKESKNCLQNGKISLTQSQNDSHIFTPVQKGQKSSYAYEYNENILALNINSFMGGAKDIWRTASYSDKSKIFLPQSSSDGKLQFVSFSGSMAIGMQKTIGGFSDKVYQGSGPFFFNFKKYEASLKHRTYLQIDGQFYRFTHPKEIFIQKSPLLQGKFKVLRWEQPQKPKKAGCGCFG